MGNTLQSAVPLERNPIGTKAQQNENTCPIRSKEAFVLTGRPLAKYVELIKEALSDKALFQIMTAT